MVFLFNFFLRIYNIVMDPDILKLATHFTAVEPLSKMLSYEPYEVLF